MQPLPSWISPLTLQIAPNLKKSPSTELQRRENPHENEYWLHFQQQGDGAGISLLVENVPNHFIGVLVGFRLAFA
jgi:hypothetical protein